MGGSKHELFPAKHPTVFSVRGASTKGKHGDFNPSLPKYGEKVFATLGIQVPAMLIFTIERSPGITSGHFRDFKACCISSLPNQRSESGLLPLTITQERNTRLF
jgi:hypothetical protein